MNNEPAPLVIGRSSGLHPTRRGGTCLLGVDGSTSAFQAEGGGSTPPGGSAPEARPDGAQTLNQLSETGGLCRSGTTT